MCVGAAEPPAPARWRTWVIRQGAVLDGRADPIATIEDLPPRELIIQRHHNLGHAWLSLRLRR